MAADTVTGKLVGRAVERHTNESHDATAGGAQALCRNCGTALIGEHCHRRGQSGHVHRTVGAIGHELAHGVFHVEDKMWRALPMLAFRPGELTRRDVHGERARFVSPLALFLFSVFLMFAVVTDLPERTMAGFARLADGDRIERARRPDQRTGRGPVQRRRAGARHRRPEAPRGHRARRPHAGRGETPPDAAVRHGAEGGGGGARSHGTKAEAKGEPESSQGSKRDHARENPKLLIYKLKSSAYKYSWALIPLSLPFMWLLFPFRRDVGLYDHAIFATYSLSFMSLLVIALAIPAAVGAPGWLIGWSIVLLPPLHMYEQPKGAYRLSRLGGLWRTAWMLVFAEAVSLLFVVLMLGWTLVE